MQTSGNDVPGNGSWPVSAWYSIAPREKMSARGPSSSPRTCSGDMYSTVPTSMPCWVIVGSPLARAMPKSSSLIVPSCSTITLAGLRSRWIRPALWTSASAEVSCTPMRSASSSPSCWSRTMWSSVRPCRNSIAMKQRPESSPYS